MFACQFLSHALKALFFYQNNPKIKSHLQKNSKFLSAGSSAPGPPCIRQLGVLPPDPQPSAAGGPPPDPQNSPSLRISGYAPGYLTTFSKNPDTKNKSSFGAGLKRVFTAIWNGFTRSTWQRQTMNSRPKESGDAVCTPEVRMWTAIRI